MPRFEILTNEENGFDDSLHWCGEYIDRERPEIYTKAPPWAFGDKAMFGLCESSPPPYSVTTWATTKPNSTYMVYPSNEEKEDGKTTD